MHKIFGFTPTLLNILIEPSVDISIRQAAVLCFKNNVSEFWRAEEENDFTIHEQDKQIIRNSIVTAIVSTPYALQ